MPGFFLTNSIQLSQVSVLVNLTDPSLRFGMVDAFKCLEKETKTTKTLYKENLDCVHVLKSVHEPIRVCEISLTAHDSSRMRPGHAHGKDLWMLVYLLPLFQFSWTLTRTRITDTDHNSRTYGWLALIISFFQILNYFLV